MREIKFRGKRLDNGEWVYGYLYRLPLPSGEACMILTQDNNHEDNSLEPKYHLAFTLWVDLFAVDPATIGQFTGLHDKNGKEIYEGDIVEFYEMQSYCINPDCEPHIRGYGSRIYKYVRAVRFEDCSFGVDNGFIFTTLSCCGFLEDNEVIDEMKNDPYFDANGYDIDSIDGIEVIGNVFDNSDLIEKGGEL